MGAINTNNLTPSDRQKIQEMSDRYIGLPMDKSAKVEQAEKMLAYLKSQLPTDKADQAFRVLAENGIFNQPRYAVVPLVVPVIAITLEELALLGVSATVLYNAWNIGGVPLTDRIRSYFDGAGVDTSGCGGMDIPIQGNPEPMITPIDPDAGKGLTETYPDQSKELPLQDEGFTDLSGQPLPEMEGFDIHRPSVEDLVKYKKKGGNGYEQPRAHPAPKDGLSAFPEAERVRGKTQVQGGGKLRERWKDRDFIYEWDAQHGTVEKYNKRGNHIGEFNPNTGEQTKPKDSKRRIEP